MKCHFWIYIFLSYFFFYQTTGKRHFNYRTVNEWKSDFPECGGRRQSPIPLNYSEALHRNIPLLSFINYDVPVSGHVKAINNGHTIQIDVPKPENKDVPCVSGGGLNAVYKVKGFHFHWGSLGVPGSEHSINGQRYDLELHIVHKKYPYHTLKDAMSDPFGIVVLAVLFEGVQDGSIGYTDMDDFYEALPHLSQYESEVDLELMKMGTFLGQLKTDEFYTYLGSLTTPPCPEAAVWYVFPDVYPIQYKFLERFWNIHDTTNDLLLHNIRPMQPINSRKVWYRKRNRES